MWLLSLPYVRNMHMYTRLYTLNQGNQAIHKSLQGYYTYHWGYCFRAFTTPYLHTITTMAESDVSRPSALPTANLRLRGAQTLSQPTNAGIENEHDSEAYLDAFEEDWNKRIDSEMDVLVEGMTDLVSLAQVCYINSLVLISLCLGSCIMHHTRLATKTSSA
jgi:hypothetical protein